jgi:hypothetical protein
MRVIDGGILAKIFKHKLLQILTPSSIKIALGTGAWLKEVKGHLINDL